MKTRLLIIVSLLSVFGCDDTDPVADWERVDLRTNEDLHAISFFNNNVGFIGAAQKVPLSESRNAFNSYEYSQEIHINSDSTKHYFVEVHALNPEPVLFKTMDGGNTWRGVATPFISDVVDVFMPDEMTVYVMTSEEGLYRTMDGGVTWKRVLSNGVFLGGGRIENNLFRSVHFFTALEGIAYNQYKGVVVKTVDGGLNWYLVPFFNPELINVNVRSVVFPGNNGRGFAIYGGQLVTTADFGDTWGPIEFTVRGPMSGEVYRPTDLAFIDEKRGLSILEAKPHLTVDGGQSWDAVAERGLWADRILLTERDEIYMQSDGNPSFSYLNPSTGEYRWFTTEGDPGWITDWCLTGNAVFAVGWDGVVLKYNIR